MKKEIIDAVYEHKVIAIIRGFEPDVCVKLAEAYYAGGIRLVEVTFPQAKPEDHVKTVAAVRAMNEQLAGRVFAGCGTVITRAQLHMAKDAGAHYIVTPTVNTDIIKEANDLGLVTMPGAMTPTEAVTAFEAGADFVKLFPAGTLGPKYMKDLRAPLSHIPFLAVGGITSENIPDFMKVGAVGIGVGGQLSNKDLIAAGAWDKITEIARTIKEKACN